MADSRTTAAGGPVGGSATDDSKTNPDATDDDRANHDAAKQGEPARAGSGQRKAADGATVETEPSQQEHHNPTTDEDTASGGSPEE